MVVAQQLVDASKNGGLAFLLFAIMCMLFMASLFYMEDRKSTRLNSSHPSISYAVFCLKKKRNIVVLTYDFVKLEDQYADSLNALEDPLVISALLADHWRSDRAHVMKHCSIHDLYFLCS